MNRHLSTALAGTASVAPARRAIARRRSVSAPQAPARPTARDRACLRYRANVAARAFAGSVGAYAVVAALAALLARALPMARPEAAMTGLLAALLLFPAVTIWAFLARSPARACLGVIALAATLGTVATLLPPPA